MKKTRYNGTRVDYKGRFKSWDEARDEWADGLSSAEFFFHWNNSPKPIRSVLWLRPVLLGARCCIESSEENREMFGKMLSQLAKANKKDMLRLSVEWGNRWKKRVKELPDGAKGI